MVLTFLKFPYPSPIVAYATGPSLYQRSVEDMEDSEEAAEGHRVLAEELVLQAGEFSNSLIYDTTLFCQIEDMTITSRRRKGLTQSELQLKQSRHWALALRDRTWHASEPQPVERPHRGCAVCRNLNINRFSRTGHDRA